MQAVTILRAGVQGCLKRRNELSVDIYPTLLPEDRGDVPATGFPSHAFPAEMDSIL